MSIPRSTRSSVGVHPLADGAPPSARVLSEPRYGVVNVQSYASASSRSSHAAREPGIGFFFFSVFSTANRSAAGAPGMPPPNRRSCPRAHTAAAATFSGGSPSSSHSLSAHSALKWIVVPLASCVRSRRLPNTISGRCDVPSDASSASSRSLPKMGVVFVSTRHPPTRTPLPASRNSPPALASARMSHLSLSMPGDRDAGGPRPGNDVIVLP
mmetsp:Transcript_12644/g.45483  ORF Transcript_12644/g.45483 Transcript_12644/m.45483 type:complete len:212 (-) Transcript_12644:7-642(-)